MNSFGTNNKKTGYFNILCYCCCLNPKLSTSMFCTVCIFARDVKDVFLRALTSHHTVKTFLRVYTSHYGKAVGAELGNDLSKTGK